jgi:hypothetical protein
VSYFFSVLKGSPITQEEQGWVTSHSSKPKNKYRYDKKSNDALQKTNEYIALHLIVTLTFNWEEYSPDACPLTIAVQYLPFHYIA